MLPVEEEPLLMITCNSRARFLFCVYGSSWDKYEGDYNCSEYTCYYMHHVLEQ